MQSVVCLDGVVVWQVDDDVVCRISTIGKCHYDDGYSYGIRVTSFVCCMKDLQGIFKGLYGCPVSSICKGNFKFVCFYVMDTFVIQAVKDPCSLA